MKANITKHDSQYINLRTGGMLSSRRDCVKGLVGLAGILATGQAPAAFVRSMLGARNAVMFGGGANWRQVEYIETDGYCRFDLNLPTGYKYVGFYIDAYYANPIDPSYNWKMVTSKRTLTTWGAYSAWAEQKRLCIRYWQGKQLDLGADNAIPGRHTVDFQSNNGSGVFTYDNNEPIAVSTQMDNFDGYVLMGCGFRDEVGYQACAGSRVYAFKAYVNGETYRDLLPVLTKDGVACFYDKIHDELLFNGLSGTPTPGPFV